MSTATYDVMIDFFSSVRSDAYKELKSERRELFNHVDHWDYFDLIDAAKRIDLQSAREAVADKICCGLADLRNAGASLDDIPPAMAKVYDECVPTNVYAKTRGGNEAIKKMILLATSMAETATAITRTSAN